MLAAFARRPLTQSPRYLRSLAALPSTPLRCLSTGSDPSKDTSESDAKKPDDVSKPFTEARALAEEDRILHNGPIFSEGSDVSKLSAVYKVLTTENSWRLTDSRRGVAKEYYFKTYTRCLDFAQSVGIQSKYLSHHPTMTIKPNHVKVLWTTHQPHGLSEKDLHMAKFCDERANLLGGLIAATAQRQDPPKER